MSAHKGKGIGGTNAQRILIAVHAGNGKGGPATRHQIKLATNGEINDKVLDAMIGDLDRRGYLSLTKSGGHNAYRLTPLGLHQIPRAPIDMNDTIIQLDDLDFSKKSAPIKIAPRKRYMPWKRAIVSPTNPKPSPSGQTRARFIRLRPMEVGGR